jgi:hypothetical protein
MVVTVKTKRKPGPAPKAKVDTLIAEVISDTPIPALKADTLVKGPKQLPKTLATVSASNSTGLPEGAPGYVVRNCPIPTDNTPNVLETMKAQGWYLCKRGDGYILDEDVCGEGEAGKPLTFRGDYLVVMTVELYAEREALKRQAADGALPAQLRRDKAAEKALARQTGVEAEYIPATLDVRTEERIVNNEAGGQSITI